MATTVFYGQIWANIPLVYGLAGLFLRKRSITIEKDEENDNVTLPLGLTPQFILAAALGQFPVNFRRLPSFVMTIFELLLLAAHLTRRLVPFSNGS